MSIRTLKTFLAVARYGSFAEAAKGIGLTQPAVSQQMKALEEELDVRLFDRSGHSVKLNRAARKLEVEAAELVARYDALPRTMRVEGLGGQVSIGGIPPTFSKMMPEALKHLRQDYPGIEVRVTSGRSDEIFAKVERGELDAGVVSDPPLPLNRGLVWHPVAREPLVLIAGRGVRVKSMRELFARETFIRVNRQSWTGRLIDRALRTARLPVRDLMELDSIDAIVDMVSRGLGVSIIPLYEGAWQSSPDVKWWLISQPRVERTIGLIEREPHSKAAITGAFLASLKRAVPKAPAKVAQTLTMV